MIVSERQVLDKLFVLPPDKRSHLLGSALQFTEGTGSLVMEYTGSEAGSEPCSPTLGSPPTGFGFGATSQALSPVQGSPVGPRGDSAASSEAGDGSAWGFD